MGITLVLEPTMQQTSRVTWLIIPESQPGVAVFIELGTAEFVVNAESLADFNMSWTTSGE